MSTNGLFRIVGAGGLKPAPTSQQRGNQTAITLETKHPDLDRQPVDPPQQLHPITLSGVTRRGGL
jgi:hypothetical protein